MSNVLNLASKGKSFKNRTLKLDTREHKFVVSQPTHLRNTYTRLADRYNEPQADQATIPVYDQTPPQMNMT